MASKLTEEERKERRRDTVRKYNNSKKRKEYMKEYIKKYIETEKGKDVRQQAKKKYRQSAKGNETEKEYLLREKDKIKESRKRYRSSDLGKDMRNAHRNLRRARKMEQTCNCCMAEDFNKVYANCPEGYEVDHIEPLARGGAHCLHNLQYLTIEDNRAKGAKKHYIPRTPPITITMEYCDG